MQTNDSVLLLSHPIWQALSVRDIAGPGPFTVFIPHTNVLNNDQRVSKKAVSFQMEISSWARFKFLCFLLQVRGWLAKGVMAQILRYHMVGCASLLHRDLTTLTNVTSLHGDPIQISYVQVTWWRRGKGLNRLGSFSLFQKWNVSLPSLMHKNKCSIKKGQKSVHVAKMCSTYLPCWYWSCVNRALRVPLPFNSGVWFHCFPCLSCLLR